MGKVLLGDDYLLWISDGTGETPTYIALDGQGTATINRSQTKIDTSTKTTAGYATSAYGLKDLTIDLDITPILPDVGYTQFETSCNASPSAPFLVQIRKGGADGVDPADTVFGASMYGSITSQAFTQNDKVAVKAQLAIAAAPTVDTLK